jgi:hypothetical protein
VKSINKINKLKIIESFVQVSYLKGFKYIDKAGEIINLYQRDNGEVKYDMTADRIYIPEPNGTIKNIRVSNVDLWAHFVEPENLGKVKQDYIKEFNRISEIVDIGTIVRIGWRNFFVLDLDNDDNLCGILPIDNAEILETSFKKKVGDLNLNCRIRPLSKEKDKKPAILFDLDIFQTNLELEREDVFGYLETVKTTLEGDAIKKLVNDILAKI